MVKFNKILADKNPFKKKLIKVLIKIEKIAKKLIIKIIKFLSINKKILILNINNIFWVYKKVLARLPKWALAIGLDSKKMLL